MTAMNDDVSQGNRLTRSLLQLVALAKRCASEWRNRRQMATSVGALSNRSLQDIGLTPADLHMVKGLPLAEEAAQSLARAALGRAGNW